MEELQLPNEERVVTEGSRLMESSLNQQETASCQRGLDSSSATDQQVRTSAELLPISKLKVGRINSRAAAT